MSTGNFDADLKKELQKSRKMIIDVSKQNGNESETRLRVERILSSVMGYDIFQNISTEYAVNSGKSTMHCDFVIVNNKTQKAKPLIVIELKSVVTKLSPRHLKQTEQYAAKIPCDWILLTNGQEWQLHHIASYKPLKRKIVDSWDLVKDDYKLLADKFYLISKKNVFSNGLEDLWQKKNVLTANNILKLIFSENNIKSYIRDLKKATGTHVTPEDIVGAIRDLLNSNAEEEMNNIKITLPSRKRRTPKAVNVANNKIPEMDEATA